MRGGKGAFTQVQLSGFHITQRLQEPSIKRRGQEDKQTEKPDPGKSGTCVWEDEPTGDGSIANDRAGASASPQRVEQSGIQHGSGCVLDEVKPGMKQNIRVKNG